MTPKSLWTSEAGQSLIAPPIVFGETLLLATQPADHEIQVTGLRAFDLADGSPRWQHDFQYAAVSGMQAYYLAPREIDIAVVTTSSNDFLRGEGSLLAFDQAGEVIWQAIDGEDRFSAPVVMDRKVYVLAGSNTLLTVSPEVEGDDETRIALDTSVSSSAPAIYAGVAYVPCRRPELLAVELSGNTLWHFKYQTKARDWLDMTPAISGDRLYAVSSAGSVFALERNTGEMIWQVSAGADWSLSPPAVDGDRLYVGYRRGLLALDTNNGRTLWTLDTPRPVTAAPLVLHDLIYVAGHDHYLYALDKISGEQRWRTEMARRIEMPPVMAPSLLAIVDRGGHIVALERPPEPEVSKEPVLDRQAIWAAAEAYERQGKPLLAAELWCQVGELARAADLYEKGADWLNAAQTWEKLFRYNRRAKAYEKHARLIAAQDVDLETKAQAWEQAAHAYRETTLREARIKAEREVARYRQQPIIEIKIKHDELKVETWSGIRYSVRNTGFGPARLMSVAIKPERFETESTTSVVQPVLHPGGPAYSRSLQVMPLQKGDGVPMKFVVTYRDALNQDHRFDRTFTVPVFSGEEAAKDISTSSFDDLTDLSVEERKRSLLLARTLSSRFSMDELEELLFALGINPDNLEGETLSAKARELVKYYRRRQNMAELIEMGKSLRPGIDWDQFL